MVERNCCEELASRLSALESDLGDKGSVHRRPAIYNYPQILEVLSEGDIVFEDLPPVILTKAFRRVVLGPRQLRIIHAETEINFKVFTFSDGQEPTVANWKFCEGVLLFGRGEQVGTEQLEELINLINNLPPLPPQSLDPSV